LPYLAEGWKAVHFYRNSRETPELQEFPEMLQVREFFKCPVRELMFYSVLPGTNIHPHRDMSGNLPCGCLRFHIPIVTNPQVEFVVGGRRLNMGEGELWALDTSYKHSVHNPSDRVRIHCVVEVVANDWVWAKLPPKALRYYSHVVAFWSVASLVGIRKLFTDPSFIFRNVRALARRTRA
jgi:aspartyl/asparaginyl beta-hydroxylase (cupin superfamily)